MWLRSASRRMTNQSMMGPTSLRRVRPLLMASHWKCTSILVELKVVFKSTLLRLTRNLTIRKTMEPSPLMTSNPLMASSQLMDNLKTLMLSQMTRTQPEQRLMTRILLTSLRASLKI